MVRDDLRKVTTLHNELPIDSLRWCGGQVPGGKGMMATSQGLVSKAHAGPLDLLNHARDGVRCGA